ncbi:MAG TPA: flagellar hook capping FlgD N-terminal domain-containing protein [Sedimentibacter sp.]|jgi:flagellar basal-body rod modification protein FlgD|nr:flagellar hook capping FlgD N-terminal domain-containing protein [Sedimentibacter sp.]HPV84881.1 flagellar hook capping FlgD N-terminal domain-containing protein [Sedimentibacter sp.]HQK54147.1 flagellar hook capping FlgD N-terminal domain-containing protein [Sedimentibacter sp.]
MEINAYNSSYKVNNINTANDLKIQKNNEGLNMQDFLNLLVAQITNQDAMNPMDNTEFIAQMAQFSTLQAMTDLTEMALQGQATSLIGKNVVVADYNGNGGLTIDEGIVQRVTLHGGKTKLYVNDMEYEYSNVMEIKEAEKAEENSLTEMLGNISEKIDNLNNTNNSNISPTDEIPPIDEEEALPYDETQ